MLRLVSGDMRNGGEDISGMSSSAFDAVAVIDAAAAGFGITVEVLEIVIEIDRAGAEVTA